MSTTSKFERENNTHIHVSSSPWEESINNNTIYVHTEPSAFRDLVQKLTGAPNKRKRNQLLQENKEYLAPKPHNLPSTKRPKYQERRRCMILPARLEIPFTRRLQVVPRYYKPINDPILSPVSTTDYAFFLAYSSPLSSPNSFTKIDGPALMLSKEEEEREEKAIQEKGFYLHNSPRGVTDIKPKLLHLFRD